jgi:hypothetical protein
MIERLTNADSIKHAERRIRQLIGGHGEWLCVQVGQAKAMSLLNSECDVSVAHHRLIFTCWGDEGSLAWRVTGWEWTGEKLLFEATRRMGAESALIELIPRASVKAAVEAISATRRERCQQLTRLACSVLSGARVERAGLSAGARRGQPGAFARITLRHNRERIAVTGRVAGDETGDVDAFLSSALVWFAKSCERVRAPYIQKLWLISEKERIEKLRERLVLLREDLRRVITLLQIDKEWRALTNVPLRELDELLAAQQARFRRPAREMMSESAAEIVALAPDAIDVARARHGETLRFHGLAFARVRRVMQQERVWFGVESARRRLLDENTLEEWAKLLQDLQEHRRAVPADQHHALYKAAPEAWLESLLRRDITRLDPGLIIAPLYAQFRPSHAGGTRPIDLLALRHDGRLVVIELKVAEDVTLALQGADYWRRVEAHRVRGHISQSRIFGTAEISDEPPLVYLVAPMLRFHRSFQVIAHAISRQIEMYRFDINEDWRAEVRVMRRALVE